MIYQDQNPEETQNYFSLVGLINSFRADEQKEYLLIDITKLPKQGGTALYNDIAIRLAGLFYTLHRQNPNIRVYFKNINIAGQYGAGCIDLQESQKVQQTSLCIAKKEIEMTSYDVLLDMIKVFKADKQREYLVISIINLLAEHAMLSNDFNNLVSDLYLKIHRSDTSLNVYFKSESLANDYALGKVKLSDLEPSADKQEIDNWSASAYFSDAYKQTMKDSVMDYQKFIAKATEKMIEANMISKKDNIISEEMTKVADELHLKNEIARNNPEFNVFWDSIKRWPASVFPDAFIVLVSEDSQNELVDNLISILDILYKTKVAFIRYGANAVQSMFAQSGMNYLQNHPAIHQMRYHTHDKNIRAEIIFKFDRYTSGSMTDMFYDVVYKTESISNTSKLYDRVVTACYSTSFKLIDNLIQRIARCSVYYTQTTQTPVLCFDGVAPVENVPLPLNTPLSNPPDLDLE